MDTVPLQVVHKEMILGDTFLPLQTILVWDRGFVQGKVKLLGRVLLQENLQAELPSRGNHQASALLRGKLLAGAELQVRVASRGCDS